MLALEIQPSPFRPPKTPLRSLPPPKIQNNGLRRMQPSGMNMFPQQSAPVNNNNNNHVSPNAPSAGGMNGHAPPFAPSPAPLHADPLQQQQQQQQQQSVAAKRQMHAPPNAIGAPNLNAKPAAAAPSGAPFPPVPTSKALPIINKQTGEAVKSVPPLPPSAIEAPLAPFDNDPMLPVGHSPAMKPTAGGKVPGLTALGAESDSEFGASGSSASRFGASGSSALNRYAHIVISEESMESQEFTTEEMLSVRHCSEHCPEAWLKLVLSDILPRIPANAVPARLKLLKDAPDHLLNEERGGFGSAKGADNVLNAAAALRLRVVKETHHKVMSVLSRITPEKYEALKEELMNLPLRQTDEKGLKLVVEVFFEKAVQEPVYSQLYAALVSHMCHVSEAERQLPREDRDKLFASRMRRELLNKCQEEFSKPYTTSSDETATMSEAEVEQARRRFKKRLCGNIKFVCELYARTLVTDRVVDNILTILSAGDTEEDYVAEAIATTIMSAGSIFSRHKPEEFEKHMAVVSHLKNHHPSARIKFLMMDVEDSRKRGFERKNKVMTQDELDKQQLLDQKKLNDDMDKALKEQSRQHRRQKKTIPSVPNSPVTPSRQPKKDKGILNGRLDPHTPTSPSAGKSPLQGDMLPPPAPPSPSTPPSFPARGLYSAGNADSTTSLSSMGGPVAPMTKDQTAASAKDWMTKMVTGSRNSVETTQAFEEVDKLHRMQILTAWLRLAATSTKLWTEREQLPGLFAAMLTSEESAPDFAPLTSAELSKVLHDWVIVDIDSQQYDNCPRMFSNWSAVIDGAAKYNNISAPADAKVDPATILHPGILNLFLQEYRRQAESSSVVESFSKDVIPSLDSATEHNLAKVMEMVSALQANGEPQHLSSTVMTLLQRFRPSAHLAYVEGVESPTRAGDVCKKLLENKAIKDDLELNLFKVYATANTSTLVHDAEVAFSKRSKSLSPVHNLLKAASAATAVLLPYHGSSMKCEGTEVFATCTTTEERATLVAASLKSIHNNVVLSVAHPGIAEHLCGIVVLAEALQHAAFAVSTVTDRSPLCSPNTQQAPKTPSTNGMPLPRSASGSDIRGTQTVQLEFEQQLTAMMTTKLCDLLVASESTAFVNGSALTAVRCAVGGVQQDVWAVSPPPSLRPILGGGAGVLMPTNLMSQDDLTASQMMVNSPSKITPTSSPLHSKAIATSMLGALAVTAP